MDSKGVSKKRKQLKKKESLEKSAFGNFEFLDIFL